MNQSNNLPVTRAGAAGPGLIPGPLATGIGVTVNGPGISMRHIDARQFVLLTATKSHKLQAPSYKHQAATKCNYKNLRIHGTISF